MTVEFYFYYTPGKFPGLIVNTAVNANPSFHLDSYLLCPWQGKGKWTLKMTYQALSATEIELLDSMFKSFPEYDGWGQDVD